MSGAHRGSQLLVLIALGVSVAVNVLLWRQADQPRTEARESRAPIAAPTKAPPKWSNALAAPVDPCPQVVADRSRELERMTAELLRRQPYEQQYKEGAKNEAARRSFEAEMAPALSTLPRGASISSDCHGAICRVELRPSSSGNHSRSSRWLSDLVRNWDAQMGEGEGGALTYYVRLAQDRETDGREILARFNEGYSWDSLRETCAREGPLPLHPVGVVIDIVPNGDGDATFRVTLVDRSGLSMPEASPTEICLVWTLRRALADVELPPTATRANLSHYFEGQRRTL